MVTFKLPKNYPPTGPSKALCHNGFGGFGVLALPKLPFSDDGPKFFGQGTRPNVRHPTASVWPASPASLPSFTV